MPRESNWNTNQRNTEGHTARIQKGINMSQITKYPMLRVIENAAYIKSRLSLIPEQKTRDQILSDDGCCSRVSCSHCPLCSDTIFNSNHHCYTIYVTQNRHDTNAGRTYMFDILSRIRESLWTKSLTIQCYGFSTVQALYGHVWRMNSAVKLHSVFIPKPVFAKYMDAVIIARSCRAIH